MSAQFVIAVTSSLTTAAILWMLRIVVKARNSVVRLTEEHRFLMESMRIVLKHLDLDGPEIHRRKR